MTGLVVAIAIVVWLVFCVGLGGRVRRQREQPPLCSCGPVAVESGSDKALVRAVRKVLLDLQRAEGVL